MVGGIDKVFEINRNFRNEGSDSTHSPEFAMLEFYEAYATYDSNAVMTRELVQEAAESVFGTQVVTLHDGTGVRHVRRMDDLVHVRLAVRGAGRGGHPGNAC